MFVRCNSVISPKERRVVVQYTLFDVTRPLHSLWYVSGWWCFADFKDFAPTYSLQGKQRLVQSEPFASLTERADYWFESCDVRVLNIQTVDSPSYYKCWRDATGKLEWSLVAVASGMLYLGGPATYTLGGK